LPSTSDHHLVFFKCQEKGQQSFIIVIMFSLLHQDVQQLLLIIYLSWCITFVLLLLTHSSFRCDATWTLFNLLSLIIIFFPIAACHWWIIWMVWACVLGIRNNIFKKYIYLCLFVPGCPDSKAVSYFQPLLNFFPYGIKKSNTFSDQLYKIGKIRLLNN